MVYQNPVIRRFLHSKYFENISYVWSLQDKSSKFRLLFFVIQSLFINFLDFFGILLTGVVGTLAVSLLTGQAVPSLLSDVFASVGIGNIQNPKFVVVMAISSLIFFALKSVISLFYSQRLYDYLANLSSLHSRKMLQKFFVIPLDRIKKLSRSNGIFAFTEGVQFAMIGLLGSTVNFISESFFILIILTSLFVYQPLLAVFLIVFGFFFFLPIHRFTSKRLQYYSSSRQESFTKDQENILDILDLIKVIKSTGNSDFFLERFYSYRNVTSKAYGRLLWIQNFPRISIEISIVFVMGILGLLSIVIDGATSAIVFILVFVAAVTRLAPSILRLQQSVIGIRSSSVFSEPSLEYLNILNDYDQNEMCFSNAENVVLSNAPLSYELINVSYAFPDDPSNNVINNLSFRLPPSGMIGIIGESGVGKSTLCDLLAGFYPPSSGKILLNDLDLSLLLASKPGLISFLPQDIRLISESIVSNVAFGVQTKNIDMARIKECLKNAGIWNYLSTANISLASKLDNSGSFLSGGQRQRLALARALYCNSRVIILDEPTSSLDSKSAKDLLEILSLISSQVLVVIVSHDDSLLDYTDFLIRIAKNGTVSFPNA